MVFDRIESIESNRSIILEIARRATSIDRDVVDDRGPMARGTRGRVVIGRRVRPREAPSNGTARHGTGLDDRDRPIETDRDRSRPIETDRDRSIDRSRPIDRMHARMHDDRSMHPRRSIETVRADDLGSRVARGACPRESTRAIAREAGRGR